jgi:hypothetical protein
MLWGLSVCFRECACVRIILVDVCRHNPKRGCEPTARGFDYFYGLPYSHEEGFPGPSPESYVVCVCVFGF